MLIDLGDEAIDKCKLRRLDIGLYRIEDYLSSHYLIETNEFFEFHYQYPEFNEYCGDAKLKQYIDWIGSGQYFQEFASCDSPKQFLSHSYGRAVQQSNHSFIVLFHHMKRENFPDFRWHKNGGYIGEKKQEYEHLGHEEHIDEIYQYHIYRKRSMNNADLLQKSIP